MGIKFDLYEENGVKEYGLVEPQGRVILVYGLKNGKYNRPQTFHGRRRNLTGIVSRIEIRSARGF